MKLINGDLSSDDKHTIAAAIQASEDLLDVYILAAAYSYLLDLQPATQYRADAVVLSGQLASLIKRVDMFVRMGITAATGYGLFRLYRWLIPIIRERWNEVEPIAFVIQVVLWGLALLIVILIGAQPNKLKFINGMLKFFGTIILRLIGINRREAEKRISQYLGH